MTRNDAPTREYVTKVRTHYARRTSTTNLGKWALNPHTCLVQKFASATCARAMRQSALNEFGPFVHRGRRFDYAA